MPNWLGASSVNPLLVVLMDTDMDFDCDDLVMMALILDLRRTGDCEIAALTTVSENNKTATCMDLLAVYSEAGDIPIGAYHGSDSDETGDTYASATVTALAATYGVNASNGRANYPNAVTVFRQALADVTAGRTVRIITGGGFKNMADLLASPADGISPLNGVDLVAAKVESFHVMGGDFPSSPNPDSNTQKPGSAAFAADVPVPVYWYGAEVGGFVKSGFPNDLNSSTDPYAKAWELSDAAALLDGNNERQSWDSMPVIGAILEDEGHFSYIGPGNVDFSSGTEFTLDAGGKHYYADNVSSNAALRTLINTRVAALTHFLDA